MKSSLEYEIKIETKDAEKKLERISKSTEKLEKDFILLGEACKSFSGVDLNLIVEQKQPNWRNRYWKEYKGSILVGLIVGVMLGIILGLSIPFPF